MRPGLLSVRVRLTAWYAGALVAIILVFSLSVYFFVRSNLFKQLDRNMERNLVTVETALREELEDNQEDVNKEVVEEMEEIEELGTLPLFQIACNDGIIYKTAGWGLAWPGDARARGPSDDSAWFRRSPEGRLYRLKGLPVGRSGQTYHIMLAEDVAPVSNTLGVLATTLIFGLPCALAVAVTGGYFLAGRVLSPIGAMASKAKEISAESLSERLPAGTPDDEFGQLASIFNDTLRRLEESFERLRRFTADASHELRTPLTALRSVGEVSLREDGDLASCRIVIGSMLEEADRLGILVDNLLTLTRGDAGRTLLKRESVDLAVLVNDVVECLRVLAEEKEQSLSIEIEEPINVEADRASLRRALINLLDNAIRYTPKNGCIRLRLRRTAEAGALVEIEDTGPGIAREHHAGVFERFYRVDKDRSSERGGAGLGLSIASRSVELNGGRIELESEQGKGSTFRVVLPVGRGGDAT